MPRSNRFQVAPPSPLVWKLTIVAVVAQPHQHLGPVRVGRPAALDAVLVGDEVLGVEAQAAAELAVVEQDQAGAGVRIDLDLALDLVGLVAVDEDQRRTGWTGPRPSPSGSGRRSRG